MENGFRQLTEQDLNSTSTTKQNTFGAQGMTGDGREFRYVGFGYVSGTTTFNPGLLMIAPVAPANSTALTITATSVSGAGQTTANLTAGSSQLVITNGATTVWQDEFKEGYLTLNIGGSGVGVYNLKIAGNTAATASTGYITVFLQDPIPASATTLVPGTDTASLRINPWSFVIPSLTENKAIGFTMTPSTAATAAASSTVGPGSYGWVQVGGPATVSATSGTLGYPVGQDTSGTAGFVINKASGTTTEELGTFITAQANGLGYVYLNIS
jgi:hypothetical protein